MEQEPSQEMAQDSLQSTDTDVVAIKQDFNQDVNLENNAPVIDTSAKKVTGIKIKNLAGGISEYTVRKGDTLMLISYKVYGDYSKWRELSQMNPGISANSLTEGAKVQFRTSDKYYPKRSPGMAYLIQDGDTLGTISSDKYGTVKKWRNIYENNRQLIRDPNLIFSGFTLYLPKLSNEVASNYIELQ
jgi:nucleoid-associated protein YgaU